MKLPSVKYDVVYADPPWPKPKKKICRRVRPNQIGYDYPVMSIEEIKALPVESIAKPQSVLFMWCTQACLPESFDVVSSWGFNYQRMLVWDKQCGMCFFGFHHRAEFLLFGYRGKLNMYPKRKAFPTVISIRSQRHSEKPQIFRDLIKPFGEKRIELFARTKTVGWDVWGNEV